MAYETREGVQLLELVPQGALIVFRAASLHQRKLGLPAQHGQRRPQLVSDGGAELTHLGDRLLQPGERLVEGVRHFVELVSRAAERDASLQARDVDAARGLRHPCKRRQGTRRHPASEDQRQESACRQAPEEQAHETPPGTVDRVERYANLQKVGAATARREQAAGQTDPSVIGLHVDDAGSVAKGLNLGRRVVKPERRQSGRLHQQLPARRVVDLVVPRGTFDERHLLRVGAIVGQRWRAVREAEVPVEATRNLLEIRGRVRIQLPRENLVVRDAERSQEQRQDRGVEDGELRAERKRSHGGLSVSM